jgi:hypothetical protein
LPVGVGGCGGPAMRRAWACTTGTCTAPLLRASGIPVRRSDFGPHCWSLCRIVPSQRATRGHVSKATLAALAERAHWLTGVAAGLGVAASAGRRLDAIRHSRLLGGGPTAASSASATVESPPVPTSVSPASRRRCCACAPTRSKTRSRRIKTRHPLARPAARCSTDRTRRPPPA